VRDFVYKKCVFISVADGLCFFESCNNKDKWVIIIVDSLNRNDLYATVARNVAYAWLQHKSMSNTNIQIDKQYKEQALALLANWGLNI